MSYNHQRFCDICEKSYREEHYIYNGKLNSICLQCHHEMSAEHNNVSRWMERKKSSDKWLFDLAWMWDFAGNQGKANTVCEVGIGPKELSILPQFEVGRNCRRLIGIEPHPEYMIWAQRIPGIELHAGAVVHPQRLRMNNAAARAGVKCPTVRMVENAGSTYMMDAWTPTPLQSNTRATFEAPAIDFTEVDPGDIDVLNLDCEGAEWDVLTSMLSQPIIIAIEIWPTHPERDNIVNFLVSHGYRLRVTSGPEGETTVWSL